MTKKVVMEDSVLPLFLDKNLYNGLGCVIDISELLTKEDIKMELDKGVEGHPDFIDWYNTFIKNREKQLAYRQRMNDFAHNIDKEAQLKRVKYKQRALKHRIRNRLGINKQLGSKNDTF